MKKWLRALLAKVAVYSGLVYLIAGAFFYFEQDKFLFPAPKNFGNATPRDAGLAFEDLRIPVGAKGFLHGWWIPATPDSRIVIVAFHGNGYVLGDRAVQEVTDLHLFGTNLLMVDYRGYGTSTPVVPDQETVEDDANAALRYLLDTRKTAARHIVVMGRSIGSGPATYLASRNPNLAGAIIATPFTSIADAARQTWYFRLYPLNPMLHTRFENLAAIGSVKVPVLILAGTADTITPPWMAGEIFTRANEPKRLYLVPGAEHNDLLTVGGTKLTQVVKDFVQGLIVR